VVLSFCLFYESLIIRLKAATLSRCDLLVCPKLKLLVGGELELVRLVGCWVYLCYVWSFGDVEVDDERGERVVCKDAGILWHFAVAEGVGALEVVIEGDDEFFSGDEDFLWLALERLAHDEAFYENGVRADGVVYASGEAVAHVIAAGQVGDFIEPAEALLLVERHEGGHVPCAVAQGCFYGFAEIFANGLSGEEICQSLARFGHHDQFVRAFAGKW